MINLCENLSMKPICFSLLLILAIKTGAQTTEDSIKQVVQQIFVGMQQSNPQLIMNSFSDSAFMQTIVQTSHKVEVRTQSVAAFAKQVATMPAGTAEERIVFDAIKIDGPLAAVWTPYTLYINGNLYSCGVNSFQLVRVNGLWKVQYIIDTRRRTGCK
jgi:hypothetical protein